MVAYSFRPRFIHPICAGLGIEVDGFVPVLPPKRQTIRANGKRRHARPGDELQLYTGMRTKACRLIGRARCVRASAIEMEIEAPAVVIGEAPNRQLLTTKSELDAFARRDGFASYEEMALFWYENHHATMNDFAGVLIEWEPL